jgi:tetratricopeptide (TPR) repeat protein
MENYTSALEALGEAESAYKVLGNDDERAAVLEDTASSYVAQQQYDEALKALEKARRLWVNTGDRAR